MGVDLVHKLVKVVLVSLAQVDKRLDRLIRVCGHVLPLTLVNDCNGVVGKLGEIRYRAVHICRLVNADKRFIEDGEQVSEQLKRSTLFDHVRHLDLVARANLHLK